MFNSVIKDLNQAMLNEYHCVNYTNNPVMKKEEIIDSTCLTSLIFQYSLLPKNIISFFITALYNLNFHGWKDISKELTRNLNEELGQPLENDDNEEHEKFLYKPHYVILREGIINGLNKDIKQATPKEATNNFLYSIKHLLDNDNPSIVGGAVYALESSAIPELQIIYCLTTKLFKLNDRQMPDALKEFFLFHIDEIEIGHRDRLADTCSKYVHSTNDIKSFEIGFREVLMMMDTWWTELSKDIR